MTETTARDLGKHDAQIDALQRDVEALRSDVKAIRECLSSINTTMAETRGGWRVLLAVAGTSGLVGAGITKALHSLGIAAQ